MAWLEGGSSFTSELTNPTGYYGSCYMHEVYTTKQTHDESGVYLQASDGSASFPIASTVTDFTNVFASNPAWLEDGLILENQTTREKVVISDSTNPTVVRGFDDTGASPVPANSLWKFIGFAVQANAAEETGTATTLTVDTGAESSVIWDSVNLVAKNLGWVLRKERKNAYYGELAFVSGYSVTSGVGTITVFRNFGHTNVKALTGRNTDDPTNFQIADNEWLIIDCQRFANPWDTTGTYGLKRWYQCATLGEVTFEIENEDIVLMTNELGATRVIQPVEDWMITMTLVNPVDYVEALYDGDQIDANYDKGIAINALRQKARKEFALFSKTLDDGSSWSYLFYGCANTAAQSVTINDGQTEFPLTLRTLPSKAFDGKKGVKINSNVG